ncbi:BrxE family protein [Azospirillum brasilense]|uniref:BrxE family protein n=1 Tax=Azospirillum brasilense TaxID=192 RepID=UPI00249433F6|nr:BrxE family protein [Azospirillum brasilense]MBK3732783.1 BrxE family protein [Azospirillum brasilense]
MIPNNQDVSRLRVLVGYLGERQQSNWWASSFLDGTSEAFLAPVFGQAIANARVVGVTEAARRVHDDAIGVGRAFHLFRLPETLEQELHRTLALSKGTASVESVEKALEELNSLSSGEVMAKSGPVLVGPLEMLADVRWVREVAGQYHAAFTAGVQSFPFFAG